MSKASRSQPVIISIILALMLAIAPMPDWALPFRPDWVTLTLIYWAMNLPRTYSVGSFVNQVRVAEIMSVSSDPYRHVVVVNKGTNDGVFDGQAMIDDE